VFRPKRIYKKAHLFATVDDLTDHPLTGERGSGWSVSAAETAKKKNRGQTGMDMNGAASWSWFCGVS